MIPYIPMNLSNRPAKVLNGGLPTEKHGQAKKAYIDLKLETLVATSELDAWLATEGDPNPTQWLYAAADGNALRLPDVDQVGKLREGLEGELRLTVGAAELTFDGAHTVGSVNRLEFINGGNGRLVIQFRVDPGEHDYPVIRDAIERGDCMLAFEEYPDKGRADGNEKQDEMPV